MRAPTAVKISYLISSSKDAPHPQPRPRQPAAPNTKTKHWSGCDVCATDARTFESEGQVAFGLLAFPSPPLSSVLLSKSPSSALESVEPIQPWLARARPRPGVRPCHRQPSQSLSPAAAGGGWLCFLRLMSLHGFAGGRTRTSTRARRGTSIFLSSVNRG